MTGAETVSMLFSDLEDSTRLVQELDDAWPEALSRSRDLCRLAWSAHRGHEMGTQGDSFFVVFPTADDAVAAAIQAQQALASASWPAGATLRARMGIHTGSPTRHGQDLVGLDVHVAARVASAAHGGQVLLSGASAALLRDRTARARLRSLGAHRLKGIPGDLELVQVTVPGLADEFPPVRTAGGVGALPQVAGPLVGRDGELSELSALLAGGVRLVTLTGPGGSGKSRLSIAVGSAVSHLHVGGAWFVPLASATSADELWPAISQVLQLPREAHSVTAFIDQVRDRRLLLILDNLEQISGVEAAINELLERTADLTVVASSRRALRLAWEHEHPVPPLVLPDENASVADASGTGSVQLFTQHATRVRSDFAVTDDNVAAIVEVCRAMDGLPLAIELAASRIRLLSPAAMSRRLDGLLDIADVDPTRPDRQRTLRAAMEWSFRLLSQDQQTLLARLGVFVGGATLEAIGAVALRAFDDDPDVLDLLAGLVDASFVKAIEDPDGEPRFVLLETIRVFALEQLAASGEIDATYDDHSRHLYCVMQRLRTQRDEDFGSFVPAVLAELGNIGVVVDRLLSGHIPDEIAPLGRRWHAAELAIAVTANSGSLVMAYTWGLRFVDAFARVAAPPAPMEVLSRAMCLARVAWLARALDQQDVARRTAAMAVRLSDEAASGLPDAVREDGADGLPAVTMVALGAELWAALDREDFEVARGAAVGLSRLSPLLAPGLRSAALSWTADAGIVTKDFDTALRALEAGQDALRDEGSPDYSRACWEYQRAAVDAYRGEGNAALDRARACLDLVVSLDEPVLLDGLGEVVMVAIGAVDPRASARIEGALGAFRDRTPGTASEAFTRLVDELMGPVRRRLTDAEWAAEMAGSAEVPLEQALRQALDAPASAPTPA